MEELVFRTLSDQDEIEQFIDRFGNFVGVQLPLPYVLANKVVGAFLQKRLVGGYIIVTKPPFRSTMFVPDSIKNTDKFFKLDPYDMMEVNGVWISPTLKTAKLQFSVWKNLLKDVFFSGKKYVLLMRNAKNKNVDHIHSLTNPTLLYMGTPSLIQGLSTHQEISISFTTRWKLVRGFHSYWNEYKKREKRQRRPIFSTPRINTVVQEESSQPEPIK
ncbi:MAG: hypothetical protein R3F41_04295 [Gammaproteobacteria bacterium]|nr:hypothetical protein [Pseudomonadales bacterium]